MCKLSLDISSIQESRITLPVSVFSSLDVLWQLFDAWQLDCPLYCCANITCNGYID